MEVCDSGGEQPLLLHWDRKLSELCEPADTDTLLCHTVRSSGGAAVEGRLRRCPAEDVGRAGVGGLIRPRGWPRFGRLWQWSCPMPLGLPLGRGSVPGG